jgi:hypothetical protein
VTDPILFNFSHSVEVIMRPKFAAGELQTITQKAVDTCDAGVCTCGISQWRLYTNGSALVFSSHMQTVFKVGTASDQTVTLTSLPVSNAWMIVTLTVLHNGYQSSAKTRVI